MGGGADCTDHQLIYIILVIGTLKLTGVRVEDSQG